MSKKHVPLVEPMQMGFGFEVQDTEGNEPPFLHKEEDVYLALDLISQAQWASVDVETTGLTEASMPITLDKTLLRQGASNRVRMRTIQVRVPTEKGRRGDRKNFAFDTDKMSPELVQYTAETILKRRIFIAHNAGFDLYWLRRAQGRTVMPSIVIDTMLMTRLMDPKLVLKRGENLSSFRTQAEIANSQDLVAIESHKSIISKASGGSLADVVLAAFDTVVPKQYQKPKHWAGLLGFDHYNYAIDDVIWGDRILCHILNLEIDQGDILRAYLGVRARQETVRLVEPQVPDLVRLREKGMPFNPDVGRRYAERKVKELASHVSNLLELEPSLEPFRIHLSNPNAGETESLKKVLAAAFERRGVALRYTEKQGLPKIGEKDLRACRAARIESSKPLFNAWVAVCKTKKLRQMALDVVGFALRSDDGRLHSLMSHGPVTGRLSAAEPNCQQWPRDPLFRAMCMSEIVPGQESFVWTVSEHEVSFISKVIDFPAEVGEELTLDTAWTAAMFYSQFDRYKWPEEAQESFEKMLWDKFTHIIVASDFGALDVRVGAALAIRSQREMLAFAQGIPVPGEIQPSDAILAVVKDIAVLVGIENSEALLLEKETYYFNKQIKIQKQLDLLRENFDADKITSRNYFPRRRKLMDEQLEVKLGWRLAQCMRLGAARGESEYSALRDAFVADIDIHTFTGMKLAGRDPIKEFEGLSHPELKKLERKIRAEIGEGRQQGKIANLSLLYGMGDLGFQEAAAAGYDEHWTLEEASEIRSLWFEAYPEAELWQLWTEALKAGDIYLPEPGRERLSRTSWWLSRTLANREIVAFGINSALSYQDQSSGADILAKIMHRLQTDFPDVFETSINQVHDEQVFAVPRAQHDELRTLIHDIMVAEANSLTMPYGVPTAVGPASAPLWFSD